MPVLGGPGGLRSSSLSRWCGLSSRHGFCGQQELGRDSSATRSQLSTSWREGVDAGMGDKAGTETERSPAGTRVCAGVIVPPEAPHVGEGL